MSDTIGHTEVTVVGNSLHVRNFGALHSLIDHVLSSFDPSVVTLAPGVLPITLPTNVPNVGYDDLAAFPSNKSIDILMYLALPADVRAIASTITTAAPPPRTEIVLELIQKKKNIASVFLMNYLLHGTPRQMEANPPQVAKFLLDATGLTANDFRLNLISALQSLGGFRSVKLVVHTITIFNQGSTTLKSRMKKGFGGSRVFTIARAMRFKQPMITSPYPEIRFFLSSAHDNAVPYVTYHPDHPKNPMKDHAQRVFMELGQAFTNAGGSIDELAAETPAVFIPGVVARLKASPTTVSGDLPNMSELIFSANVIFSLKLNLV